MNNRIREVRNQAGLSMQAFGDKIGVSAPSVSKIEAGINNPSEQTIRAICSEFNVNRDWLVDGIGDMRASRPLVPELMRVLRTYPALQSALEHMIDCMGPEEWEALNKVVAAVIEKNGQNE